jgi:hypothetical protein
MKAYICSILMVAVLAGCGDGSVRENLGLVRQPPDEFKVVSRAPLTVPKEFFLYPPEEASERAAYMASDTIAREALLGGMSGDDAGYLQHYQEEYETLGTPETAVESVGTSSLASPAEEGLLQKLQVKQADPNIRSVLHEETAVEAEKEKELLNKIKNPIASGEPIVDAEAERERLKKNKEKGRAVNEGDVPTVTPKTTILDKLL